MVSSVIAVIAVAVVVAVVVGLGRLEGGRPGRVSATSRSVLGGQSRFQAGAALEATASRLEAGGAGPSSTEYTRLNGVWAVISSATRQTEAILTEISRHGSLLGTPARRLRELSVLAVLAGDCLLGKRAV